MLEYKIKVFFAITSGTDGVSHEFPEFSAHPVNLPFKLLSIRRFLSVAIHRRYSRDTIHKTEVPGILPDNPCNHLIQLVSGYDLSDYQKRTDMETPTPDPSIFFRGEQFSRKEF